MQSYLISKWKIETKLSPHFQDPFCWIYIISSINQNANIYKSKQEHYYYRLTNTVYDNWPHKFYFESKAPTTIESFFYPWIIERVNGLFSRRSAYLNRQSEHYCLPFHKACELIKFVCFNTQQSNWDSFPKHRNKFLFMNFSLTISRSSSVII